MRAHRRDCKRRVEEEAESNRLAEAIKTDNLYLSQVMNHSAIEGSVSLDSTNSTPLLKHDRVNRKRDRVMEILDKDRVKFPDGNRIWTKLNETFDQQIKCQGQPYYETDILETKFVKTNNFIYDVFTTFCNKVDPNQTTSRRKTKKEKTRDEEEQIKAMKKELKKEWKTATSDDSIQDCKKRFFKLIRLHNKLRKAKLQSERDKNTSKDQLEFRKNPYKCGKKLLHPDCNVVKEPSFTKEEAEIYFGELYKDVNRGHLDAPPEILPKPKLPVKPFDTTVPSKEDITAYIKKRKNSSKGGTNQIQYIMLKKCPALMKIYVKLIQMAWKVLITNSDVDQLPIHWIQAKRKLMPKSDDLSDPSKFRDINLSNIDGKIFFGLLSKRAGNYMTENRYINTNIQKGFIRGIPGVLEHTYKMTEMLKNASEHQRQLCITWLDLKNAFGSVRHDIINFAMSHYHWPEEIQSLIHEYYSELYVKVETKSWKTQWISIERGIFQGDTIADSLFNLPWNLCLDILEKIAVTGYCNKELEIDHKLHAYVDDLTLTTSSAKEHQILLDTVSEYLGWTEMEAKPEKCRSFARRKFSKEGNNLGFVPLTNKVYSQYDPRLTIQGKAIPCLNNESFRMLGKKLAGSSDRADSKALLKSKLTDYLDKVDQSMLTGIQKSWIYQHLIIPSVTWELSVYEYPISFIEELNNIITKYLKRWLKITKSADKSIIYRSKEHFGLSIPNIVSNFKKAQMAKEFKMKTSKDQSVKKLYKNKLKKEQESVRWKPTVHLENTMRNISLDEMASFGQSDRKGVGYAPKVKIPYKKKLGLKSDELEEDKRIQHAVQLEMQGSWTNWENIMNQDLTWKSLLYGYSPNLLSFALNSVQLTLPTPDNLKRWGKNVSGKCELCNSIKCTLQHILTGCKKALQEGRYTWRHDSILTEIGSTIKEEIKGFNERPEKDLLSDDNRLDIRFVKAKEKIRIKKKDLGILHKANDWIIHVDLEESKLIFPVHVWETSLRPDAVMISNSKKIVIMLELTSPMEENIIDRNIYKRKKYNELLENCRSKGWNSYLFCFEVGARGFVSNSFVYTLKTLGIDWNMTNNLKKLVSKIALRCSYAIYLQRNTEKFVKWS